VSQAFDACRSDGIFQVEPQGDALRAPKYFEINKIRENWAKNAVFFKIGLDRISMCGYFRINSVVRCCNLVQVLTEREKQI
jgi:hypothetical protein